MLYSLFTYLDEAYNLPGAGLFHFISFRASLAMVLSLIISVTFGENIIRRLRKLQIGETVRELGLDGQKEKEGTPTMGGIIIILAILIPVLLVADLSNTYVLLMIVVTMWLGIIGFIDDYIKVFRKNKKGLSGKLKLVGQVVLGLIVGLVMLNSDDVVVSMKPSLAQKEGYRIVKELKTNTESGGKEVTSVWAKAPVTNVPFLKSYDIDYTKILGFMGEPKARSLVWLVFIPIVIFIVTGVSNSANLTDGLDGLATGLSAIMALVLALFAYVASNRIAADYLNILYLPGSSELVIFTAALFGATIGFLWHNSFPASVFMGDTGSLMLGGVIATLAILLRKELLLPILSGVFMVETMSVMLQVSYFKYTRKKYGEGRRIFKMSPLHHHFQKLGMPEMKIATRFWIVGILLAIITIMTLKIR